MLFKSQQFKGVLEEPAGWSDHVFHYCDFSEISADGGEVDSVFVGCKFENCDWYWTLFNLAIFVSVDFSGCTFRGTSFSSSKFVECNFDNCKFIKDNLDGECSFNDTAWYKCTRNNSPGLTQDF